MKPLFIGQAPGAGANAGDSALGGRCGARLARLAGLSDVAAFLRAVDTRNVLAEFPGRSGRKGDRFPLADARALAHVILAEECEREVIVFIGLAVAAAFAFDQPPCVWRRIQIPRRSLGVIPHPSGVNVWYNDAANLNAARRFLREAVGTSTS